MGPQLCFTTYVPQRAKSRNRFGVVFPGESKSRLGYVLKTSGHTCVGPTALVFKFPPPSFVEKSLGLGL